MPAMMRNARNTCSAKVIRFVFLVDRGEIGRKYVGPHPVMGSLRILVTIFRVPYSNYATMTGWRVHLVRSPLKSARFQLAWLGTCCSG